MGVRGPGDRSQSGHLRVLRLHGGELFARCDRSFLRASAYGAVRNLPAHNGSGWRRVPRSGCPCPGRPRRHDRGLGLETAVESSAHRRAGRRVGPDGMARGACGPRRGSGVGCNCCRSMGGGRHRGTGFGLGFCLDRHLADAAALVFGGDPVRRRYAQPLGFGNGRTGAARVCGLGCAPDPGLPRGGDCPGY